MMTSGQKEIERDRGAGGDRLKWKMRKLQQTEKVVLSSEIKEMKLWYRSVLLLVDSPEDRGDADDCQQEKPRERW